MFNNFLKEKKLDESWTIHLDCVMPAPMMKILNGGSHADNTVDIQEFMIVPIGAQSFAHAMQIGIEVFHNLKNIWELNGN